MPKCRNPVLEGHNPTGFYGLPVRQPFPVPIGKKPFSAWEDRKPGGIAAHENWLSTPSALV